MATKSFTTDMKFDKKNVNDLLRSLENNKKPNLSKNIKFKEINSAKEVRSLFGIEGSK